MQGHRTPSMEIYTNVRGNILLITSFFSCGEVCEETKIDFSFAIRFPSLGTCSSICTEKSRLKRITCISRRWKSLVHAQSRLKKATYFNWDRAMVCLPIGSGMRLHPRIFLLQTHVCRRCYCPIDNEGWSMIGNPCLLGKPYHLNS